MSALEWGTNNPHFVITGMTKHWKPGGRYRPIAAIRSSPSNCDEEDLNVSPSPPRRRYLPSSRRGIFGARAERVTYALDRMQHRPVEPAVNLGAQDRKSTRLNSSHSQISYA